MMDKADAERWFPALKRNPEARMTLFCLPHAGGDAINYWPWLRFLPPHVQLRCASLPGKYGRAIERPFSTFDAALDQLEYAITPLLMQPYVLFGHSMGALLAYELARRLARSDAAPLHLIASGLAAPHLYRPDRAYSRMSDQEVTDFLRDMNGTPPALLASKDAMGMILPALRADLNLCETYAYRDGYKLDCAGTIINGHDDAICRDDILPWQNLMTGNCEFLWLPGDHMFVLDQSARVVEAMMSSLERAGQSARPHFI